jgi:hypothetical protein
MAVYGLEQAQALWRLDLAEKKWSRCADLPDAIHGRTMENSGFAISKGKLYCYSCREGLEPASSPAICAYDPASDSWEEIPMEKLCRSAQLFAIEDELFLVTDIRMEEEDEAGEPGTEAEEAENAGTEAEEAECSGTGAEEAEDAGTEAEEAKGSGTETEETEEDTEEYVSELKAHFVPQPGFSANYKLSIDGKKKPLIIEVNTRNLECYYGIPTGTLDVEMQLQKNVMDEITNGRMTFQRAFMGGDMKMKGDFRILRSLDQIFNFVK